MSDLNISNENKIEKSEYVVSIDDKEYGFGCTCGLSSLEEARRYAKDEKDQESTNSISIWLVNHPKKVAVVGNVVGESTDIYYRCGHEIDDYHIYYNKSPKDVISLLQVSYNLDEYCNKIPDERLPPGYNIWDVYSIFIKLKIPSVFEYFMSKKHTGDSENNCKFIENFF